MCIIAIKAADKAMFSDETIKTMFRNNSHGAGLMYLKPNGTVHIEKGFFKVEDMLAYIHKNIKTLEKTHCVLHFRIATSGKKDELGCHPYPVWQYNSSTSKDTDLAMAHNGVLDSYGYNGNDAINDTQVFIKDCLRKLPRNFLKNQAIMKLIASSIGYNKLVFLDKDGIHTVGRFIEDDGYYYSNDSYKPRVYSSCSLATSMIRPSNKIEEIKLIELDQDEKINDKSMFNKQLSNETYDLLTNTIRRTCDYIDEDELYSEEVYLDSNGRYCYLFDPEYKTVRRYDEEIEEWA